MSVRIAVWFRGAALAALAALAHAACLESDQACYPSDWRACTCDDGKDGYQQCEGTGAGYNACDCSGAIPGVGTGGDTCAGEGEGDLAFMCACTTNDECESGLCHPFNMKGPHCSLPCAMDSECPPPSPGCNNMGVCKAP